MVTCPYRFFFIVLIVKMYYISALVTFCGVEWSLVSFLFEKKIEEDAWVDWTCIELSIQFSRSVDHPTYVPIIISPLLINRMDIQMKFSLISSALSQLQKSLPMYYVCEVSSIWRIGRKRFSSLTRNLVSDSSPPPTPSTFLSNKHPPAN